MTEPTFWPVSPHESNPKKRMHPIGCFKVRRNSVMFHQIHEYDPAPRGVARFKAPLKLGPDPDGRGYQHGVSDIRDNRPMLASSRNSPANPSFHSITRAVNAHVESGGKSTFV